MNLKRAGALAALLILPLSAVAACSSDTSNQSGSADAQTVAEGCVAVEAVLSVINDELSGQDISFEAYASAISTVLGESQKDITNPELKPHWDDFVKYANESFDASQEIGPDETLEALDGAKDLSEGAKAMLEANKNQEDAFVKIAELCNSAESK